MDLHFQEYWVRRGGPDAVKASASRGRARPRRRRACSTAIARGGRGRDLPLQPCRVDRPDPRHPGPAGMRWRESRSWGSQPIVGGRPLAGMADRLMPAVGLEVCAAGAAKALRGPAGRLGDRRSRRAARGSRARRSRAPEWSSPTRSWATTRSRRTGPRGARGARDDGRADPPWRAARDRARRRPRGTPGAVARGERRERWRRRRVTQKVVSKAEGRIVPAADRAAWVERESVRCRRAPRRPRDHARRGTGSSARTPASTPPTSRRGSSRCSPRIPMRAPSGSRRSCRPVSACHASAW